VISDLDHCPLPTTQLLRLRDRLALRLCPSDDFDPGRLMRMRFHTRTILRDRREAFLGSQSLREPELDKRRELGMIVHDHEIVHSLVKVFEGDWAGMEPARHEGRKEIKQGAKTLKKAVKAIVRELPLAPIVECVETRGWQGSEFRTSGNELQLTMP
jgi:hypothetical protein